MTPLSRRCSLLRFLCISCQIIYWLSAVKFLFLLPYLKLPVFDQSLQIKVVWCHFTSFLLHHACDYQMHVKQICMLKLVGDLWEIFCRVLHFLHSISLLQCMCLELTTLMYMKGSWIVRQSVGSTPCLLGKAVDCNYIRGPKYLEVKTYALFSFELFNM